MAKSSIKENNKTEKPGTERIGAYAKTALAVLGIGAGIVSLAVLPGLAVVANEFMRHGRGRTYRRRTMRATVQRLAERGYVRIVEQGEEVFVQLTKEGRRILGKLQYETLNIQKPDRWDGLWRFVAFDIPEKKRALRIMFRKKLLELGFVKIEKSLFMHPFPCDTEIAYVVGKLAIGPYVHCVTAMTFDGAPRWRRFFKLS